MKYNENTIKYNTTTITHTIKYNENTIKYNTHTIKHNKIQYKCNTNTIEIQ